MAATLGISEILFALSWNFDNQLGIRIAGLHTTICHHVTLHVLKKDAPTLKAEIM